MSERPSISLHAVTKRYLVEPSGGGGLKHLLLNLPSTLRDGPQQSHYTALTDVSLEVSPGECLGIIGPNGSGKSTTLGLIAGVLEADQGRVETHGRICPLLELGAGFHHQLTGRDNIVLNAVLLGLSRSEITARLDDVIEFAGLREFIDRPIRTYSSGMLERLGFAVATHTDPDILLIDEALAVGDARFQEKCFAKMSEFRERGVAMVFVSHDLEVVAKACSRLAIIDAGRVVYMGDPAEGIDRYRAHSMQRGS